MSLCPAKQWSPSIAPSASPESGGVGAAILRSLVDFNISQALSGQNLTQIQDVMAAQLPPSQLLVVLVLAGLAGLVGLHIGRQRRTRAARKSAAVVPPDDGIPLPRLRLLSIVLCVAGAGLAIQMCLFVIASIQTTQEMGLTLSESRADASALFDYFESVLSSFECEVEKSTNRVRKESREKFSRTRDDLAAAFDPVVRVPLDTSRNILVNITGDLVRRWEQASMVVKEKEGPYLYMLYPYTKITEVTLTPYNFSSQLTFFLFDQKFDYTGGIASGMESFYCKVIQGIDDGMDLTLISILNITQSANKSISGGRKRMTEQLVSFEAKLGTRLIPLGCVLVGLLFVLPALADAAASLIGYSDLKKQRLDRCPKLRTGLGGCSWASSVVALLLLLLSGGLFGVGLAYERLSCTTLHQLPVQLTHILSQMELGLPGEMSSVDAFLDGCESGASLGSLFRNPAAPLAALDKGIQDAVKAFDQQKPIIAAELSASATQIPLQFVREPIIKRFVNDSKKYIDLTSTGYQITDAIMNGVVLQMPPDTTDEERANAILLSEAFTNISQILPVFSQALGKAHDVMVAFLEELPMEEWTSGIVRTAMGGVEGLQATLVERVSGRALALGLPSCRPLARAFHNLRTRVCGRAALLNLWLYPAAGLTFLVAGPTPHNLTVSPTYDCSRNGGELALTWRFDFDPLINH